LESGKKTSFPGDGPGSKRGRSDLSIYISKREVGLVKKRKETDRQVWANIGQKKEAKEKYKRVKKKKGQGANKKKQWGENAVTSYSEKE